MKRCARCGFMAEDSARFCSNCGESSFLSYAYSPPAAPEQRSAAYSMEESEKRGQGSGNVLAGIIGAILFSIGGFVVFFLLYQLNVIASISGIVTFVLAEFGYKRFSRGDDFTAGGIIIALIVTVAMMYVANYFCVAFEVYKYFHKDLGLGVTIMETVRAMPELFEESHELKSSFSEQLAKTYVFSAVGVIGFIISMTRKKKK